MTEQQKRSLFFNATGKVATINYFEYFIFCKGMDVEREACAKMCDDQGQNRIGLEDYAAASAMHDCAAAIRARGNNDV